MDDRDQVLVNLDPSNPRCLLHDCPNSVNMKLHLSFIQAEISITTVDRNYYILKYCFSCIMNMQKIEGAITFFGENAFYSHYGVKKPR